MMDSNAKGKRKRHRAPQSFAGYLNFGVVSTLCIGCFLLVYLLLVIGLIPLINTGDGKLAAPNSLDSRLPGKLAELKGKEQQLIGDMATNLKKKLDAFRDSRGVTDKHLMDAALSDFQPLRARRKPAADAANAAVADPVPPAPGKRPGFVVLGMHRSGTSMLSGLLVHGCGYNVGGPLIGANFDNEKGFFERVDVVLQNDEFMKSQKIWWSSGVKSYDGDKAYEGMKNGNIPFKEGTKALSFLNDPINVPWLQKDPRMCICLKTWLKLLSHEPAIVFTYRHPLEVALSLKTRERNFPLQHGLRLWVIYNMQAIQNSKGLCIVYSSNDAVLASPLEEVQRISTELTSKCGVPEGPSKITQEEVDKFIDPNMQHGKKKIGEDKRTLEEVDGCAIPEYDSDLAEGTPERQTEESIYKIAMKIHCDFKSGKAYQDGYEWPELP